MVEAPKKQDCITDLRFAGESSPRLQAERVLFFKRQVNELGKSALLGSTFSSLRRDCGKTVHRKWKVDEGGGHFGAELCAYRGQGSSMKQSTGGTFEIDKLDDVNGCIGITDLDTNRN